MKQEHRSEVLGPVDSAFYFVESDRCPMNIGALTLFEGAIPFKAFVKLVDSRIHRAPIYQKKLIEPLFNLAQPRWMFDPEFHVSKHIFQITLDHPGDMEDLNMLVGQLVSSTLDRNKPLWEVYLIDGLHDGSTALFFKVHHCMVDGLSAVELFTLLFDLTPEAHPAERKPLYDPAYLPGQREFLFESLRQEIPFKLQILDKLGTDFTHFRRIFGDREARRKALIGMAHLINNNLGPIKKLEINGKNSGRQILVWSEFSLAEVRAIKSNRGASVNDVMLTVLSGAIESYQRQHQDVIEQEFLRVLVPVNMRMEDDNEAFGNRISVLPIDIPFGVEDPLERLQAVADFSSVMKQSSLSNGLDVLLTLPSLALAPVQPLIWGVAPVAFSMLAHTWCTNVAGPQIPVYILGHQMMHSYGFFPLNPSMGLACVIMSYNQRITMTLVADTGIIDNPKTIQGYLESSYLALRRAAKIQPIEPIVIEHSRTEPVTPRTPVSPPPATNNATEPSSAVETVATAEADEPVTSTNGIHPVKIFSDPWTKAYRERINSSPAYYKASTRWTAGSLAFIMQPSPANGYPETRAIFLDLHKGVCRDARTISPQAAQSSATFVLEGSYASWMKVLRGEVQPLAMIMRGKLRLKKGSLTRLMPFTQSAQELINCAQEIT